MTCQNYLPKASNDFWVDDSVGVFPQNGLNDWNDWNVWNKVFLYEFGHNDVSTTMIYTHVLNRGGKGVRSPADGL
jgi:hypothetical protein